MKLRNLLFTSFLMIGGCSSAPVCNLSPPDQTVFSELDTSLLDSVPSANRQREAEAMRLLESVGCDRLERQFVSEQFGHNLVCEIEGTMDSELLIAAHYDKHGVSRGIADNWTGVAALVSMAGYYREHRPVHTMRFVMFTGEEKDLAGSRFYVEQTADREQLPAIMVNLDTLGVTSLKVDANSSARLRCVAQKTAAGIGTELGVAYISSITGDWLPFRDAGVPVLAFHSLSEDTLSNLHGPGDRRSLVVDALLKDAYLMILNAVDALDHGLHLVTYPRETAHRSSQATCPDQFRLQG